jgi:sRNA-binding protein
MRPQKNRSRSNKNRNRSPGNVGNIVNRVFDSSGPEGKVRGTPQQIIDKYHQLARDAQLAGDRVALENFQQHAEHYMRMLSAAQREQDARREQQEQLNRERQAERDRERAARQERDSNGGQAINNDPADAPQPDVIDPAARADGDSGLVETPETAPVEVKPPKPRARRKPRKPAAEGADAAE